MVSQDWWFMVVISQHRFSVNVLECDHVKGLAVLKLSSNPKWYMYSEIVKDLLVDYVIWAACVEIHFCCLNEYVTYMFCFWMLLAGLMVHVNVCLILYKNIRYCKTFWNRTCLAICRKFHRSSWQIESAYIIYILFFGSLSIKRKSNRLFLMSLNFTFCRGNQCLIDWKTSKRAKTEIQHTYDNPVQVAAYAGAMNFLSDSTQVITTLCAGF